MSAREVSINDYLPVYFIEVDASPVNVAFGFDEAKSQCDKANATLGGWRRDDPLQVYNVRRVDVPVRDILDIVLELDEGRDEFFQGRLDRDWPDEGIVYSPLQEGSV